MKTVANLALAGLALCAPLLSHAASDEASRCQYVKVTELPIRYVGAGLDPAVDATINNAPATMVIATAFDTTSLTMTAVARHDLILTYTGMSAVGINSGTRIYGTHVDEMGIGPLRRNRGMNMAVLPDASSPSEYDGILGAPFLLQTDLMLDLGAKQLKMFRPHNCENTALLMWKEDTSIVPAEDYPDENPNPHFKVLVNGKTVDAVISSGARYSFLTLAAAERVGIDVKNDSHVLRTANTGGAQEWIAPVQSVQIGRETIKDVKLGVVEARNRQSVDLFLGQDFLRSHRVLFAKHQNKLYVAYVSGEVFTRAAGIEPWVRQEADAGNADARYALANAYNTGNGVARDPGQARHWLKLAAAQGQPNASVIVARQQMQAGQLAEALPKLRAALDQLPSHRYAPLWLYITRVRNGEAELGRTELAALMKRQQMDNWPYPIAQFYLGKWDAARLLEEAGKEQQSANRLTCQAETYIAEWHDARGDKDQAKAVKDSMLAHCSH